MIDPMFPNIKYIPMLLRILLREFLLTLISWLEYLTWKSKQPIVWKDCGGYKITVADHGRGR